MSDVTQAIMREIESDPTINATDILLDLESKGLFKKRKTLHIRGAVHSVDQKGKVVQIAQRHAGDECEVVDHLVVK
jgi:DNA polymerase III delta subunit